MTALDTSIKKNTVLGIFISLSLYIYPIATYPYITRVLQPEGLGRISFVASFVVFFTLISQLGMPIYGLRSCAKEINSKEKLQNLVAELLLVQVFSGCTALLLYGIVVLMILPFKQEPVLFFIYGLNILACMANCEWLYKAAGKYSFLALANAIFRCAAVAAVYLLVRDTEDLYWYALISLLAGFGSFVAGLLSLRSQLGLSPYKKVFNILVSHTVLQVLRGHIRPLLIFFLMSCAVTIYTNTDTVMLGLIKDNRSVGIYSASAKVKALLVVFTGALWTAALPRSAILWKSYNIDGFRELAEKSLRMIPIVSLPLAVFFIAFSEPFIQVIAGTAYMDAGVPMRILLLAVIPIGISNIIGGQLLIPIGQEKLLFKAEMTGVLVNIVANTLLIPPYNVVGAAVATLLSETLVTVVAAMYILQFVSLQVLDFGVYIKSMIACGAGLLAASCFSFSGPVIIRVTVAALTFFSSFITVMFFLGDEFIKSFFKSGVNR